MSDPKETNDTANEEETHVLPVKLYLQVFGALLVLTVVTVGVSTMGLSKWGIGGLAIGTALAVAIVKAGLVVGYFMHLKYDIRFYSFVFFSAVLFVGLFFGLTLVDLTTRQHFSREEDTFMKKQERRDKKTAEKWLKTKKARDALEKKRDRDLDRPVPRSRPPMR